MEHNIIFCFTGTGNSLKVAKDISSSLENCTIHHIGTENIDVDISGCKRVGFIFPVYFLGLPLQVKNFISRLVMPTAFDGYLFAIGTFANLSGNATKQINTILHKRSQELSFSANIKDG